MKKIILIVLIVTILIFGFFYFFRKEENKAKENTEKEINDEEAKGEMERFISCLAERGMVIYGTNTCPACASLVKAFGGYDVVAPIYVECNEEQEKCFQEMKSDYVPEIQINGIPYMGISSIEGFERETGCKL